MKQSINFSMFCDAFRDANRDNQFTYEGKRCLFDWLEQYEEDTGEEQELDVIALCCDFYEMGYRDIAKDYRIDLAHLESEEEYIEEVRAYLDDNTLLVGEPSDGVFLFQCF